MFSWFLVNAVLSTLALLFVTLNASAPQRLRFVAGFIALLAWLVPWQLVPEFLPQWQPFDFAQLERNLAANTAEYSLRPVVIMTTGLPLARNFFAFTWVQLGFIALCIIGVVLFACHCCGHYLRLQRLRRNGEDGAAILQRRGLASPVPVIIQNEIAGAFSSGLFAPRIWIHRELTASTQLATLLHHELTHIRQHDNWYLLFITLVEKLLWWNPLVWLLGCQARELQELSCDALCQQASADYPLHLAELMIDNARLNPAAGGLLLNANIFNSTNLNIKRIKLLQRSYAMKPRHLVSAFVTALGAFATIGIVTAQPAAGERPRMLIRGQSVQLSGAAGETGNVVFIARDHAQPLTEEEVAAFEESGIFLQTADGAALQQGVITGTAGVRMMGWNSTDLGAMNQFIKVDRSGDDMTVSLNFTDTPLPMILEPLANIAVGGGVPALGIAAGAVPPTTDARQIFTQQIRPGAAPADGGTGTADVVEFHTAPGIATVRPLNVPTLGVGPAAMAFTSKLVIEDEADRERLVSVEADNVSIEAALEIIGAEANCNIFLEDDTIVVNSCAN